MSMNIGSLIVKILNFLLGWAAILIIIVTTISVPMLLNNFTALNSVFGPHSMVPLILGGLLGLITGILIDIFILGTLFLILEINNNLIEIKNNTTKLKL